MTHVEEHGLELATVHAHVKGRGPLLLYLVRSLLKDYVRQWS